ncbi:MAG: hypothetical protein M3T55_10060 [Pseudomonadota bacterium]|nr:hypothetical protein [Pseudomonadota bacterium]
MAAAALGLCSAPLADAQELWNGANLGMTPDELQTVFPKASEGQQTLRGAATMLRVPNLRAGGHDATAFFVFTADGLQGVELYLHPDSAGAKIEIRDIEAQLSSKYGKPLGCDLGDGKCDWRSGPTNITLIDARTTGGEGIEVLYRPLTAPSDSAPTAAAVSLVRAFYGALTKGDGDKASRLVVPEKRAQGPLSAEALTNFYSALPGPIHLTAAYQTTNHAVAVRYQFVASGGHLCDGAADVTTTRIGDQFLIESIRSHSGC